MGESCLPQNTIGQHIENTNLETSTIIAIDSMFLQALNYGSKHP